MGDFEREYPDEQVELLDLAHDPVVPPRAGTPAEGIFLGLWRDYLAADPSRLDRILRDTLHTQPTQRQATVCASFMTFMGCNCGAAFTHQAEQLAKVDFGGAYRIRSHAFLMAWAVENRRRLGVNSKLRTVESMLARAHLWVERPVLGPSLNWEALDTITTDDYDTVECMVEWWSNADAETMRRVAEPMIKAANDKAWSGMFTPPAEEGRC